MEVKRMNSIVKLKLQGKIPPPPPPGNRMFMIKKFLFFLVFARQDFLDEATSSPLSKTMLRA